MALHQIYTNTAAQDGLILMGQKPKSKFIVLRLDHERLLVNFSFIKRKHSVVNEMAQKVRFDKKHSSLQCSLHIPCVCDANVMHMTEK